MADDVSGITSLQFGGEMVQVDNSAIDMAVAIANPASGTLPIGVPMPQAGCVRGLSINMEEGVASGKAATLAATIGGVEDSLAVLALAALVKEGSVMFGNSTMTFEKDDELGLSLTGDSSTAIIAGESTAIILVQFGRSNI